MKKKIVHIAQSPGGVLEYIYMLLRAIKNIEEYEHILIVSEEYKQQEKRLKEVTSEIYYIPMVREIKLKEDFKAIKKIKKIIKNINPDIVYLHSSKAGALGRIALIFNFKIKILYNAHGWYFTSRISKSKKRIYAFIEKILAIKTKKIINISKSEYDSALKYKVAAPRKMCLVENGTNLERFKNLEKYRMEYRKKLEIDEDELVIGVVGRISEQKDPITMLEAFEKINKKYPKSKLVYIGDGELKEKILTYTVEKKLKERVLITGWVNNSERFLSAIDIAVLPSKWEGFGLAIIEYMAAQKPIIATKVGGIENIIINDENGILIDVESSDELENAIEKYIRDKEYKEKVIKNNYEYVIKKYDIKKVAEETIEIWRYL